MCLQLWHMWHSQGQKVCALEWTSWDVWVYYFSFIRVNFGTFNVLDDKEVREGLKKFSNWPTYPQLYIKGQFIGGHDIVKVVGVEGGCFIRTPIKLLSLFY